MPADSLALPSLSPNAASASGAPARAPAAAPGDGRPAGFGQALAQARQERTTTERHVSERRTTERQASERQAETRRGDDRRAESGHNSRPAANAADEAGEAPASDAVAGEAGAAEGADEGQAGRRGGPRRPVATEAGDAGGTAALTLANPAWVPADTPIRGTAGEARDALVSTAPADAAKGQAADDRAQGNGPASHAHEVRPLGADDSAHSDGVTSLAAAATAQTTAPAESSAPGAPSFGLEAAGSMARTLAAGGTQAAAAGDAAGAAQAPIDTPVDSPQFGAALGHRLSLMVKDGLSEARLQLHPAEMGPLQVRIALEGQLARVDLVADHAATRQILEQSMPGLASALRDSGLTLAGGGVFDSPRDPRQDPSAAQAGTGGGRGRGGGDGDEDGPDLRLAGAVAGGHGRARGVVDLYA